MDMSKKKKFKKHSSKNTQDKTHSKITITILVLNFLIVSFISIYNFNFEISKRKICASNTGITSLEIDSTTNKENSNIQMLFNESFDNKTLKNGACFDVVFSNHTGYNRAITKLTVTATNVIPDYSPVIVSSPYVEDNSIYIDVYNQGWGKANYIEIKLKSISDKRVKTQNKKINSIYNLSPGETKTQKTLTFHDLIIEDTFTEGTVKFCFEIVCDGIKQKEDIIVSVHMDKTKLFPGGGLGDGGELIYSIVIDALNNKSKKTYSVYQVIPATETILLPIIVIPSQSCQMSLALTFEMEDGEKIELIAFEDKNIIIPYYKDTIKQNINLLLDSYENEIVCCFPFATSNYIIETKNSENTGELK